MAKIPKITRTDKHTVSVTCEDPSLADNIEGVLRNLTQQLSFAKNRKKLLRKMTTGKRG